MQKSAGIFVLGLVCITGFVNSQDFEHLEKDARKQVERLKPLVENLKRRSESAEIRKKVLDVKKKFEEDRIPKAENWFSEFGYKKREDGEELLAGVSYLSRTERIYIFMSSSVPLNVWRSYARIIDRFNLGENVPIVLRGCVGGCTYIKPTLEFVHSVLNEDGNNEKGLRAQVIIDPFLFRRYGIEKVPCFVYAKGVRPFTPETSEGRADNLQSEISYHTSCGDWNFAYHIEELYKKSGSPSLKRLFLSLTRLRE